MKKVKVCLFILLLAAFSVVNVSLLFSEAKAGEAPKFSAGFKLYGANGQVIGCDCPVLEGECICSITPIPK